MHVIIDGNNLLHAMHALAPIPAVGRETLVKVIERWARRGSDVVTLVFDGPKPFGGLGAQMASSRIGVRFSAPQTADDVIVATVKRTRDPASLRVITGDTAIRHEARMRRCIHTESNAFVKELFATPTEQTKRADPNEDKPTAIAPDEVDEWLKIFDEVPDTTDDVDRMLDDMTDES